MIRVLSAIRSRPWAITREAMETILEIAQRENETPEAVAAKLGRPLDNSYAVENRGGVAVLPVTGPLFRYANLFTMVSGATSYDTLATDFAAAVADPNVDAIVLSIDSPGGDAMGVSEFADHIFAARGTKPIVAYVDGQAASAAYWIASAADAIVTTDTGILGSIGAVLSIQDTRQKDAKNGVTNHDIVSSQSPFKRVDPATEAGRSKYQAMVDSLASVFIDKVATYRGVDAQTVMQDFGQGGVFVGQAAVDAGLADRVGSFEQVIAELQAQSRVPASAIAASGGAQKEVKMTDTNSAPAAANQPEPITAASIAANHPSVAEALRAEGAASARADGEQTGKVAERTRISGILNCEEAEGRSTLAAHLAFDTDMTVEAAAALLGKSAKEQQASGSQFDAAMRREGNPDVGADTDAGDDTPESAAERSIALGKQFGIE